MCRVSEYEYLKSCTSRPKIMCLKIAISEIIDGMRNKEACKHLDEKFCVIV